MIDWNKAPLDYNWHAFDSLGKGWFLRGVLPYPDRHVGDWCECAYHPSGVSTANIPNWAESLQQRPTATLAAANLNSVDLDEKSNGN